MNMVSSKMKRMLCILSGMNVGGAETFLMKLYRNIDRSKYQMDFCINNQENQAYEDEIMGLGGMLFRVPCKTEDFRAFRKRLFAVIKSNGYKYVLRIAANGMGFYDLKIAHDAGARVCAVRTSSAGGDLSLKAKLANFLGRRLYGRYVNVKIAPSDLAAIHTFGKDAYLQNEVTMLRNALDLDLFKFDKTARSDIRMRFKIPENARVVGHVGQLRIEKNQAFLIKAFSKLCKFTSNTYLLLVGDGDQARELRQLVVDLRLSDNVVFAGAQQDVSTFLSAMDVFVLPSFYEGMPNAVIEAQATGLKCIVSDTITREANITGLVEFLPLGKGCEYWAQIIRRAFEEKRHDTRGALVASGYEIKSATKQFERLIFENDSISA